MEPSEHVEGVIFHEHFIDRLDLWLRYVLRHKLEHFSLPRSSYDQAVQNENHDQESGKVSSWQGELRQSEEDHHDVQRWRCRSFAEVEIPRFSLR